MGASVVQWHRASIGRDGASKPVLRPNGPSDPKLSAILQRQEELEKMSGPKAEIYQRMKQGGLDAGPSLDGSKAQGVSMSLDEAVRRAIQHNLDLQIARLRPAISEAQLEAAEAAFDFLLFASGSWGKTDRPQTTPTIGGLIPVGTPVRVQDTAQLSTGIRKPLESGGAISLSTGFDYINDKTPGFSLTPDPSFSNNLTIALEQPILRNFGTDVNRAQIDLSANLNQRDRLSFKRQALQTVADVEQAYWQLTLARQQLVIRQRVLAATLQTRNTVFNRKELDGGPIQQAQTQASVEASRREVLEAQRTLRDAIDTLKQLLNDPNLPISGEALIQPGDDPAALAVQVNLLDAVTTALNRRPEVRSAMLEIEDASIRRKVAQNQALPQLDLNAQVAYLGLDDGVGSAYDKLSDGDFIEYLVGAQFEQPIGNRAGEANLRAAKLSRTTSVVRYKAVSRRVVVEVKQAMRRVQTAWALIQVNRDARLAVAENLRALRELAKTERLTPNFLDLLLNAERNVAQAEVLEYGAIVEYNIALGRLHQATGEGLERRQIQTPMD